MSDMSSVPYLWMYLMLLIQSGIPPYSPHSLPMASKINPTHGFLTSSTLVTNVWLSTESFHLLSLSMLVYPKAVFWAQSYSKSSSLISLVLQKVLSLYLLMTLPAMTSLILQTGRLQPLPSLQTMKKKKLQVGAQTLRIFISILTKVQSFKLLGLTISRDLSSAGHISTLAFGAGCWLGVLPWRTGVLSTYKAFIHD